MVGTGAGSLNRPGLSAASPFTLSPTRRGGGRRGLVRYPETCSLQHPQPGPEAEDWLDGKPGQELPFTLVLPTPCSLFVASGVWGTMAQALGEDLVQPCELQDDSSSLGSDSELSGPGPYRQADRYGFIGGSSAEPG